MTDSLLSSSFRFGGYAFFGLIGERDAGKAALRLYFLAREEEAHCG